MNKDIDRNHFVKFLLLGSILIFSFSGCEKEEVIEPFLKLNVGEVVQLSNQTSTNSIAVLATSPWTATTDADWITLSVESGEKGKSYVEYTVAKNEDEERTGNITISIRGDQSNTVIVMQETGVTAKIYVKENSAGTGRSWSDATSLAEALQLATSGSVIHVAAGTYVPSRTVTGGDETDPGDITFEIDKHVTIIGGYPANPQQGAQADPVAHKTILSGKVSEERQSYHVVTVTAPKTEDAKVVLSGLTITDGNGYGRSSKVSINGTDFSRGNGGGISIGNSIVEIIDTEVSKNKTSSTDGAGYCAGIFIFGGSEVTIRNCRVNQNESAGNGGGLWVDRSVAYVYESEFNENSGGTAPGVHAYPEAKVYMYNSTVANNRGKSFGAAFYARDNSLGVLVNCLIYGNESTSTHGGGGIMMYDNCDVHLISTTITGNKILGPGGGIYRRKGENGISIYNSVVSGNMQVEGSSDMAAYEDDASEPEVKASVIMDKAYDLAGMEVAESSFNVGTMLNANYLPIGNDNPTLTYGMDLSTLQTLKDNFDPALEDLIGSDFHGKSRADYTTMGAIVE